MNEIYSELVSFCEAYAQENGFSYVTWKDNTFRLAFGRNGNHLAGVWLGINPSHNQVCLYAYNNVSDECRNKLVHDFPAAVMVTDGALQLHSDNLIEAKKFVETVIHYMELHRKTMHA